MKTVGIIAEYNPFHLGHQYQIQQIRRHTGADHIVVVMSGDFVQRGTPAWTDKYLRTKMALAGGADLIFELPVHFSTASAEGFAYGGVSLLNRLGFVDSICFGSECGDLPALSQIARFLVTQDAQVQDAIQAKSANGTTFPAARAEVIADAFPELTTEFPGLLTGPNDILAVEYLKALYRLDSPMTPFILSRKGAGYHDCNTDQTYPSASAIRSHYARTGTLPQQSMPEPVHALLEQHRDRFPMTEDDLSDMLYYTLRTSGENALTACDMTPELWKRIQNQLPHYRTASQFIDLIKTKQYTRTRIQRVLLHVLLNLQPTGDEAAYARLLGFRKNHSELLRLDTHIPVVTKAADAARQFSAETIYKSEENALRMAQADLSNPQNTVARKQWEADLRAHDLYRYLLRLKYPDTGLADDYHTSPCILPF